MFEFSVPADINEAGRASFDISRIDTPLNDQHVQQRVGENGVGARQGLQMERRTIGKRCPAGIDDDRRPDAPLCEDVAFERRHGVQRVAACNEEQVRLSEPCERKRQPAIDAERSICSGGSRRHAKPAVVIEVCRTERKAGKFSKGISLLVR